MPFKRGPQISVRPRGDALTQAMTSVGMNFASTAGVDKAVLEAMACGCIPVSSSPAFEGILPPQLCVAEDKLDAAVNDVLALPSDAQETLRRQLVQEVRDHHSLSSLISRLVSVMSV